MTDTKRKLIEVAIPLDEINAACKADKDRKTGTIRNLHKWFAPAPLPAWRALLFAALVDDPGDEEKRVALLDVVKRLVEHGADLPDSDTLKEAQAIIEAQFPDGVPTVMDPFCGGGSTLVEAQRLGLPTFGSDLNPVPVLITRTLTELLPKVYGQQPLHPERVGATGKGKARSIGDGKALFGQDEFKKYSGYDGIVRDVTYYSEMVREQVWEQLNHYYPTDTDETPIAWMWARTATCPNPACCIETILTTSWWLSKKKADMAWIEPRVVDGVVLLDVVSRQKAGAAPTSPKVGDGVFSCLACGTTLAGPYLRNEGKEGRLGLRMIAVVAEANGHRTYRAATKADMEGASGVVPTEDGPWPINTDGQGIRVGLYGIDDWEGLYTPRQFLSLSMLARQIRELSGDPTLQAADETYAHALLALLALSLGKAAQSGCTLTRWKLDSRNGSGSPEGAFGMATLSMSWDFAEVALFGTQGKSWKQSVATTLQSLPYVAREGKGSARQADARTVALDRPRGLVATDPPYFDAIGYADLSDFFYMWHRRALRDTFPDLYNTLASPKKNELAAIPSRHHGDKNAAREYFIQGFTDSFTNLQESLAVGLPMLVVYASKEQRSGRGEETRWESILTAMMAASLEITGTWPIHMTGPSRLRGLASSAVASYIVMVCRPRREDASTVSLMDFTRELRRELPGAVLALQEASVLPVDLPQAVLGPGMRIFSRHKAVLDQSGHPIPVSRAMQLISAALGEILDEQQGELDPASRFAVAWWESHGWQSGAFGVADQLVRPQGISVDDVVIAGVAESRGGKVRLLGETDLDREWEPSKDAYPTAWEAVHHLADRLIDGGGVQEAAALLTKLGPLKDQAQMLAYRLESIAARKGWAKDQERYNALIGSWSNMLAESARNAVKTEELF